MNVSNHIIKWYEKNKRNLPWRKTKDPYKIWISEIILQQTKVKQGTPYYYKFIENFPTVKDLALASEDEVLSLWQGLGYYSRARNLHISAKLIFNNFSGIFPDNYNDILKLKGVGDYTASAISSFCYSLPHAVVDGNVIRFLSRFFAIDIPFDTNEGKKTFKNIAQEILDKKNPDIHNQAIMEFGALQCTPKKPICSSCLLSDNCRAYTAKNVEKFPVKKNKVKVKTRFIHYFLANKENNFLFKKKQSGIWKGLYDLPCIEFTKEVSKNKILECKEFKDLFIDKFLEIKQVSKKITYKLTHQKLQIFFWHISVSDNIQDYTFFHINDIVKLPKSNLVNNYFNSFALK